MPRSTTGTAVGRRPSALLTLAVAAAIGLLAGCSAGQSAQTAAIVAAVPGVNADSPDKLISLRDVLVIYKAHGYAKGESAPLSVRVFNNDTAKPVTLIGVTSDKGKVVLLSGAPSSGPAPATTSRAPSASTSATPSTSSSASAAPADAARISVRTKPASYSLLVPGTGAGQYLAVSGLLDTLLPGQSLKLTFAFDSGTTITIEVPMGLPESALPRSPIPQPSGEA